MNGLFNDFLWFLLFFGASSCVGSGIVSSLGSSLSISLRLPLSYINIIDDFLILSKSRASNTAFSDPPV